MWFRFLTISLLKLLVSVIGLFLLLAYLLPESLTGWPVIGISWLWSAIIAYFFAHWAFSKRNPTRQDVLMLTAFWLIVTVTAWLLYGITNSLRGPWIVVAPEFLVQLALEIFMLLFAAYRIRRQTFHRVLGEGTIG